MQLFAQSRNFLHNHATFHPTTQLFEPFRNYATFAQSYSSLRQNHVPYAIIYYSTTNITNNKKKQD
jgi:hypothetical protein